MKKIANGFFFIVILLLLMGIYYSSLKYMIGLWKFEDYNYCYLIPLVVIYLIWEKKDVLSRRPSQPSWKGLYLILPGLVLFWIGELGGEYYTLYLSSWLVLAGSLWQIIGWHKLKVIWFPVCFLLTMFPPPNVIHHNLSLKLKLLSSKISVSILQTMGVTAYREGNVIDLGFTQLQVVDACNGLRYLIPLIVLSLLLAYFYKTVFWKRAVLIISSVPISIFVNGLRIVSVALLYPILGHAAAEGFFHDFSGWLIFMVSLGILLAEMWLLGQFGSKPAAEGPEEMQTPEISEDAEKEKTPRSFEPELVSLVLVLGITFILSGAVEFRENVPLGKALNTFPRQVSGWVGKNEIMEDKYVDELDFSDYTIVNYSDISGKSVNFYVAYYESQRKGESIHSPETCLPGGGWVFNDSGVVNIQVPNDLNSHVRVKRAFIQKGDHRQLSYYWFPTRGRVLTNIWQMKLYNFWDALTRQRTDGALVRLITPVYGGENVDKAEQRLQAFMGDVWPVLDEFLPK